MRILNKKYWPVAVRIDYNYHIEDDIYFWLVANATAGFKIVGGSTYYFRDAAEATLFKLRWA